MEKNRRIDLAPPKDWYLSLEAWKAAEEHHRRYQEDRDFELSKDEQIYEVRLDFKEKGNLLPTAFRIQNAYTIRCCWGIHPLKQRV